jgi:hypothetical protein
MESSRTRAITEGIFELDLNNRAMKTSLYTLAAVALLLAGCSKEEITESISESPSSVATRTNARFGNPDGMPDIWFNENQGRMLLRVPPRWTHVALTATVRNYSLNGNEDPNDGTFVDEDGDGIFDYQEWFSELNRVGNSRIYRSGQDQFVFGTTTYFSLLDVTLTSNTFVDDWQGETAYLQLFVYPSGRTAEQDPKVARIRTRSVTNSDSAHEMAVIVADDPSQDVASVVFRSELPADPNDPTTEPLVETVDLGQTHFNQALGLSRWTGIIGRQLVRETTRLQSLIFQGSGSYDVGFLSGETNAEIIARYIISENGNGGISTEVSDEPVILGSRLGSTSFGEQWQLEIAIADLGDWVETVNYVFEPGEGPSPLVAELPMQLTRTEGNLRVYTSPKFSFNGNPTGNNVGGIVYMFGTGTRSSAGNANNKAELL